MTETWKSVVGYEGLYEVSDLGRVRSLKFGKEKILKPGKAHGGYLVIGIRKDGQRKFLLVHRLVAESFIPNPQGFKTVNHKDEVKTNNVASNLEWMSMKDNINYGTHNKRSAEKRSKQVQMFDKSTGELLATFPSLMEVVRVTGINQSNISQCCKGKLKSAGGFLWQYS